MVLTDFQHFYDGWMLHVDKFSVIEQRIFSLWNKNSLTKAAAIQRFAVTVHSKCVRKTAGNVSGREKRKTRAVNPCCRTSE